MRFGDFSIIGTYQHVAFWVVDEGKRMHEASLGVLPWMDFLARKTGHSHRGTYFRYHGASQ